MKELFERLRQCMLNGEDTVLITIIASSGSTPRGSGARMLVGKNGRICGTIGGGAVEYKAQQYAGEILKEKKSSIKGYKLAPNQVEDLGMICGGDVLIYLQFISARDGDALSLVEHIIASFEKDEDSWLITDITEETVWNMGIYSKSRGGFGLNMSDDEFKPLLGRHALQMMIGERQYYSEPLVKAGKVIICGGGHIGQELVPVLAHTDFRCVVLDDREEFADKRLFPMAEQSKVVDFQKMTESIAITKNDYIVIVTRGHNNDFAVAEQMLRTDAYYVGMIGSRSKIAKTKERLLEAGIPQKDIDRLHAPIGIAIKAETPAEIAISIAAELIMVRAGRNE